MFLYLETALIATTGISSSSVTRSILRKRKPVSPTVAEPSQGTAVSKSLAEWSFVAVDPSADTSLIASDTDSPKQRWKTAAPLKPDAERTIWTPPWISLPKSRRTEPLAADVVLNTVTSGSLVETWPT